MVRCDEAPKYLKIAAVVVAVMVFLLVTWAVVWTARFSPFEDYRLLPSSAVKNTGFYDDELLWNF